jgi:hypothetical protein
VTAVYVHLYCDSGICTFVLLQWYMYICIVTVVYVHLNCDSGTQEKGFEILCLLLITSTHFTCRLSSNTISVFFRIMQPEFPKLLR